MAVTLAQVRTAVADRPQIWPPYSTEPEIIGIADGVATIFSLQFENFIPGTLTVFEAPAPSAGVTTTFTAVAATAYTVGANAGTGTVATNAIITFNSAPAAGTLIGARYQATAFSDEDLQGYLTRAQALYSDDYLVLKRVAFDLIDVILMDQRRLEMLAEGDSHKDRSAYINGLHDLKAALRVDLEGGPLPGTNVPAISLGGVATTRRYDPLR